MLSSSGIDESEKAVAVFEAAELLPQPIRLEDVKEMPCP